MKKYFGTDGIRGIFGTELSEELAYLVGRAVSRCFGGRCLVARDTRVSGEALEEAVARGLRLGGCDVYLAGVLPTPAVSMLCRSVPFSCGIMISASHNPPEYNGLKVFGAGGLKLSGAQENLIEHYIESGFGTRGSGKSHVFPGRGLYLDALAELVGDLDGLEVALDCGFGAAGSGLAREAFEQKGAKVLALNDQALGERINDGCGALFIDDFAKILKQNKDNGKIKLSKNNENSGECCGCLGFAFDGDADRVAMTLDGKTVDGDSVLYNLSRLRPLKHNAVVGTVMSNIALERRLSQEGKRLVRTAVGDKYILTKIVDAGYSLGGEQSGHYILYPECASGDGILSALKMAELIARKNGVERLELTPQKTISLPAGGDILEHESVKELTQKGQSLGRVLVRKSGTEDKIRVMAEDESQDKIDEFLAEFAALVTQLSSNKTC